MADEPNDTLLTLTADIVAAHVSNNSVAVADLPSLITRVHDALAGLGGPVAEPPEELKPAVSIRASVKPDHIVCLEDGKKLKMLKRHLMTTYKMTPEQYRQRWNLPADYPMVAPNYAQKRRDLAKKIGLGRKPGTKVAVAKQATKAPTQSKPAARKPRAARTKEMAAATEG
jgi:predicted transcriptional regulator